MTLLISEISKVGLKPDTHTSVKDSLDNDHREIWCSQEWKLHSNSAESEILWFYCDEDPLSKKIKITFWNSAVDVYFHMNAMYLKHWSCIRCMFIVGVRQHMRVAGFDGLMIVAQWTWTWSEEVSFANVPVLEVSVLPPHVSMETRRISGVVYASVCVHVQEGGDDRVCRWQSTEILQNTLHFLHLVVSIRS